MLFCLFAYCCLVWVVRLVVDLIVFLWCVLWFVIWFVLILLLFAVILVECMFVGVCFRLCIIVLFVFEYRLLSPCYLARFDFII